MLSISIITASMALAAAMVSAVNARFHLSYTAPLQAADISLIAPSSPQTCATTAITWSWDRSDALPSDTVSLSIVNASSFGGSSRRKRASNRHIDYRSNVSINKHRRGLSGEDIDGAQMIPFDEMGFVWNQVDVQSGEYRLLLTIDSSQESVLSDEFYVTAGDQSCLHNDDTSGSSASAQSSLQTGESASSSVPTSTAANTSSATAVTNASSVVGVSTAPVLGSETSSATSGPTATAGQESTGSNHAHDRKRSHKGAIIAGVVVAILILAAVVICLWWRRKRTAGSSPDTHTAAPQWAEKFFGGAAKASDDSTVKRVHTREISGPGVASAAGLAAVAGLVPKELRKEKDEAALRAINEKQRTSLESVRSQSTAGEHWIDFGEGDTHNIDGPRPLSASTIDSRHFGDYRLTPSPGVDASHPAKTPATTLYAQGQNVPLDRQSAHSSAMMSPTSDGHTTISSWGTPADLLSRNVSLREPRQDPDRLSAMTQGSIGRDLIAAMPQPPNTHMPVSPFTSPEDDDDEAVTTTGGNATALQRSDSTNSQFGIKRKPVPRYSGSAKSVAAVPADQDGDGVDPFEESTAATRLSRQEVELLRSASTATAALPASGSQHEETAVPLSPLPVPPTYPYRHDSHGAPPPSLPQTPASISTSTVAQIPPESPDVPRSVGGDRIGQTSREDRDQYHLSVNLAGDTGFRISFS